MAIRLLPDTLANQIAAGEVIERPASVVKELVENSLDAGARSIRVETADAGLSKLVVQDDGCGIPQDELALALTRHATSKIVTTTDLFHIHTFGFRGEALPSMAAVSRLTLTSRADGAAEAWQITPDGELQPAALGQGTRVEVADLFYATPARRKFLKSVRAERMAIHDVLHKFALANPHINLTLFEDGAETWHVPAAQGELLQAVHPRLRELMNDDFARQALPLTATRGDEHGARLEGYISPATLHTGTSRQQFIFVNGRAVKDRSLQAALKNAYGDRIPGGRHPLAVLFISLPPEEVDVNVHPAKSEVRFRDANSLFGLVFGAVREALHGSVPTSAAMPLADAFRPAAMPATPSWQAPAPVTMDLQAPPDKLWKGEAPVGAPQAPAALPAEHHPLGAALGQIDATYIVAENADGALVVVDQHAAHERLVYEALKAQFVAGRIAAQPLLLPVTVPLKAPEVDALLAHAEDLARFGLEVEQRGPTAVVVTAVPQLLADVNPATLLHDVVGDLLELTPRTTLNAKLEHVLATLACHHSIRAGRRLSLAEMNSLLRQMEQTPDSLTCNHGRPTVVSLDKVALEKLFARR
ncbi:MAG: DNA mismatch repair endonuclease MutL [Pseudomonadaceae bacterium]|nr:DNA mismatch repair endonuclease MutL [Pseudomonadaceae bacterium]